MRKTQSRPLRAKQEKGSEAVTNEGAAVPRSTMEALASEFDVLCSVVEALQSRHNPDDRHVINAIERRLPAIEELLASSDPKNINDLFIFAVMLRSKLASLRDNAGFLIYPERYGKSPTLEAYQEIAPSIRTDIANLQAMISFMIDGFERVAGTTAKDLGIGRISGSNDCSERDVM